MTATLPADPGILRADSVSSPEPGSRPISETPHPLRLIAPDEPAPRPPYLDADGLVALLRAAGLTGRGGAGFPTWRKLAAVAAGSGRPVVIANGAEGEPASGKDATLLVNRPHLVLDGLAITAHALKAAEVYLYVGRPSLVTGLERLVAGRRRTGMDRTAVRVVAAPARFLAGEESAAVNWLADRPAVPRSKPPLVVTRGLRGRPTLVQNVETLAHLALVARFGPAEFRELGTADEPGTMLLTVGGAVRRPGVVEAPHGTPVLDVLDCAGGAAEPLSAVLLGGYHGGWVGAVDLPRATLSRPVLAGLGASLGAGVVLALPASSCGVWETARAVSYLAGESAGPCGPCLNGPLRLAQLLAGLAAGRAEPRTLTELERIAGLVEGRGACHHPDGTVRLLRSSLHVFRAEIDQHLAGRCRAISAAPVLPTPP